MIAMIYIVDGTIVIVALALVLYYPGVEGKVSGINKSIPIDVLI